MFKGSNLISNHGIWPKLSFEYLPQLKWWNPHVKLHLAELKILKNWCCNEIKIQKFCYCTLFFLYKYIPRRISHCVRDKRPCDREVQRGSFMTMTMPSTNAMTKLYLLRGHDSVFHDREAFCSTRKNKIPALMWVSGSCWLILILLLESNDILLNVIDYVILSFFI